MKYKNTQKTLGYLFNCIYWNLLALWCYRQLLFCTVPGLGYERSVVVLNALVSLGVSSGFLLSFRHCRNGLTILAGIGLTFGTYYILSCWKTERKEIILVLGYVLGAAAIYGVLVVANYIRDRKAQKTNAPVKKCIYGLLMGGRSIVGIALVTAMLLNWAGLRAMGGHNKTLFSDVQEQHNQTFADHMDTVLLLREEQWKDLTVSQRMDVLKTCADIMCDSMGMEPLNVWAKPMEEDTLGYYTDSTRTVYISLDHVAAGEARAVLNSLFHEIHHGYAYRLAEVYEELDEQSRNLMLFYDAARYAYGFENYIDSDEDFTGYLYQKVEVDANIFAGHAVEEVYDLIFRYEVQHGLLDPDV